MDHDVLRQTHHLAIRLALDLFDGVVCTHFLGVVTRHDKGEAANVEVPVKHGILERNGVYGNFEFGNAVDSPRIKSINFHFFVWTT